MDEPLRKSFVAGVERVSAWADLLNAINVYPIADGDTGRNLSISLSPLRFAGKNRNQLVRQLLMAARGNSGNIATQFFAVLCGLDSLHSLKGAVQEGNIRAWKAVNEPRRGTMLSVFDALEHSLARYEFFPDSKSAARILHFLEEAVRQTQNELPKLKQAGVVDAGALGMYIFFEAFLYTLAGCGHSCRPVTEVFKNSLSIVSSFQETAETGYCIDFVIKTAAVPEELAEIAGRRDSAVMIHEGDLYKIHVHTDNKEEMKAQISKLGDVLRWEDDDLSKQVRDFQVALPKSPLHIMTDAAGSLTRDDAKRYGFTLLNSYLNVGEKSLPETCFHPDELYIAMRNGAKVSTSQASVYERHQSYAGALAQFENVLYLCVGSVYTGNYQAATDWKKEHDAQNHFKIIDTGAASGRLGTIVLSTVQYLARTGDMDKTIAFAKSASARCEEYLFLEKLEYLAASGRLSKPNAFFGDLLKMKPVISPRPEGAKKVGMTRNPSEQIDMALEKLSASLARESEAIIMLEYSDNLGQIKTVQEILKERYPLADIILQPLSLTSGAHMGPGTWGVAFMKM